MVKSKCSVNFGFRISDFGFPIFWLLLGLIFLLFQPVIIQAAEVDLKPGDTIGPNNWQKIKDMVGPNFLKRVKQGYTFQIKESKKFKPPREYVEATGKYSGGVRLGRQGAGLWRPPQGHDGGHRQADRRDAGLRGHGQHARVDHVG